MNNKFQIGDLVQYSCTFPNIIGIVLKAQREYCKVKWLIKEKWFAEYLKKQQKYDTTWEKDWVYIKLS